MTYELVTGLALFALVSSGTPGPNNMMLMASGANFGFRRSMPHMLGIAIGFTFMTFLVGLGLAGVFEQFPVLHTVLKVVSVTYMLFLAWKIANAAPLKQGEATGSPLTFFQAAAFQWVNPKAWAMALTAVTVYAPSRDLYGAVAVALIFGLVNFPSVSVYTVLGEQVRKFLTSPLRLRSFNVVMALLLIASLYPVLIV
ncbi:MAG: LysE family translocator [Altererythrobacter sp.]|nr:LysE family translocator [Altererythrobacter sp.]